MNIKKDTYLKIINSFPVVPPEYGGIIGGKNNTITEFILDNSEIFTDRAKYVPNVEFINKQIEEWYKSDIDFYGIVHSHAYDDSLSSEDIKYIKRIMICAHENIKELYFPIIIPNKCITFYKSAKIQNNVIISKEKVIIKE